MEHNPTVRMSQVLLTYPQCEYSKEDLMDWLKTLDGYECCIVGHENHHQTEGEHLHAWVKFSKSRTIRMLSLNKLFDWRDKHPNIELVKNRATDRVRVAKYVIKDGDFTYDNCNVDEMIKNKANGKKYDTKRILETPMEQLVEEGTISPNQYRNIKWAQQDWALRINPGYTRETKGLWLWGDAGVGKTKFCEQFGMALGGYYEKPCSKWWDGYHGEEVVIMDEIRNNALLESGYLFKWADNSPCKVEMKGSTVWSKHRYFLVTSNINPMDLCRDKEGYLKDDLWEPLQRRFRIVEVRKAKLPEDSPFLKFCKDSIWDNPHCTLQDIIGPQETEEPSSKRDPPTEESTPTEHPIGFDFANNGLM
nr:MAG: rep protein [Cressdnaviricota sp.]